MYSTQNCNADNNARLPELSVRSEWYKRDAKAPPCRENAIVLVGHLRTINSTAKYLQHYLLEEGDYDVF